MLRELFTPNKFLLLSLFFCEFLVKHYRNKECEYLVILNVIRKLPSWEWWCTPIIPALGRLKQEEHELEIS
jgi:hypothetical protein